LLRM
jgi:heterotetrameric sarcosine oxidase delta subunit